MKKLIIFSLLALSGCTFVKSKLGVPSFKVGDCIAIEDYVKRAGMAKERWETESSYTVEKILEIGHMKYRTIQDFGSGKITKSSDDIAWDVVMVKVQCTQRLENYRE